MFQRLISKGLAAADLVACVSDLTRRELLALGLAEAGTGDDGAERPERRFLARAARRGASG